MPGNLRVSASRMDRLPCMLEWPSVASAKLDLSLLVSTTVCVMKLMAKYHASVNFGQPAVNAQCLSRAWSADSFSIVPYLIINVEWYRVIAPVFSTFSGP